MILKCIVFSYIPIFIFRSLRMTCGLTHCSTIWHQTVMKTTMMMGNALSLWLVYFSYIIHLYTYCFQWGRRRRRWRCCCNGRGRNWRRRGRFWRWRRWWRRRRGNILVLDLQSIIKLFSYASSDFVYIFLGWWKWRRWRWRSRGGRWRPIS